MGPKQKMASVTHNATETNKTKGGLWDKLKTSTLTGQMNKAVTVTQPSVTPKTFHAAALPFNSSRRHTINLGNDDLQVQQLMQQRQQHILNQQQSQHQSSKQQHENHQQYYDNGKINAFQSSTSIPVKQQKLVRQPSPSEHSSNGRSFDRFTAVPDSNLLFTSSGANDDYAVIGDLQRQNMSSQVQHQVSKQHYVAKQQQKQHNNDTSGSFERWTPMSEKQLRPNRQPSARHHGNIPPLARAPSMPTDSSAARALANLSVSDQPKSPKRSVPINKPIMERRESIDEARMKRRESDGGNMKRRESDGANMKRRGSVNGPSIGFSTVSPLTKGRDIGSNPSYHSNEVNVRTYHEECHSNVDDTTDMNIPEGDVTIVYTDVQGSASLWETCPDAMIEAQDIYTTIIKNEAARHNGYQISSAGETFNLAFPNPVEALAFALEAQIKLYSYVSWPEGIKKHDDAKDEPALKLKGLRVRIGVHNGPAIIRADESTRKIIYIGEVVDIAKALGSICHGGQILTTSQTWGAASGMREICLVKPQVIDCGEHLFETKVPIEGSAGYSIIKVCKQLIQLVPYDLAFDFGAARGRTDPTESSGVTVKNASSIFGRLFPPVPSKRQMTTSFLNAPYGNGRVTMCVVQAVGINVCDPNDRSHNLIVLSKYLDKQLLHLNPPGYKCRANNGLWMLAFDRMMNGVTFGLQLKSALHEVMGLRGNVDKECMFKVGIISGPFNSMSPNAITGKAEYVGPIVDRTAIVAITCEPGQVCVGIQLNDGDTADPPDFGASVKVQLLQTKKLPNMKNGIAIFSCRKWNIDMP